MPQLNFTIPENLDNEIIEIQTQLQKRSKIDVVILLIEKGVELYKNETKQ